VSDSKIQYSCSYIFSSNFDLVIVFLYSFKKYVLVLVLVLIFVLVFI